MFFFLSPQRVLGKDGNILSKVSSEMQSDREEEPDEEAHTPLPPRMEIMKDPSAQDDKVRAERVEQMTFHSWFLLVLSI